MAKWKKMRDADPGLLMLRDRTLIFKTEYSKTNPENKEIDPECYVVASGEFYCGDGYDVEVLEVTEEVLTFMSERLIFKDCSFSSAEGVSGIKMATPEQESALNLGIKEAFRRFEAETLERAAMIADEEFFGSKRSGEERMVGARIAQKIREAKSR
jgi:hypothetical protein